MIAYHIDRDNKLQEGQTITHVKNIQSSFMEDKMFPDGISFHGVHYLDEKHQNTGGNRPSYYIMEYELELIRKSYFPNLPSRFQSLFAVENLEEIKKWDGIFSANCTIWEIEFDDSNYAKFDSNLLIPALNVNADNVSFSPNTSFYYGYHYWNGSVTENPRIELLIKSPIKVIKRVQLE